MLLPTVIVMVELPAPGAAMGLGLKVTVVPEGIPVADRLMALLKPPLMVVVRVEEPCVPCSRLSEVGEAESEKFPGAVTVSMAEPLI